MKGMNKFEILEMAMRITGHAIRNSDWDSYMAFTLTYKKMEEKGDQIDLKDMAKIEAESNEFQTEFDHWKVEQNKR